MQIRPQLDKELFISCHNKVLESTANLGFSQNLFSPTCSSIIILLPNPVDERIDLPKLKLQKRAFTKDHNPEQCAASSSQVSKLEPGKIHYKYDIRTIMSLAGSQHGRSHP